MSKIKGISNEYNYACVNFIRHRLKIKTVKYEFPNVLQQKAIAYLTGIYITAKGNVYVYKALPSFCLSKNAIFVSW